MAGIRSTLTAARTQAYCRACGWEHFSHRLGSSASRKSARDHVLETGHTVCLTRTTVRSMTPKTEA